MSTGSPRRPAAERAAGWWAALAVLGALAEARGQASDSSSPRAEVLPAVDVQQWEGPRGKIDRALELLRAAQKESGAIGARYPVAVTSLAGLAVLGAGCQPSHPRYGGMLERCLSYLESSVKDGFIGEADDQSRMHGHSYAVLFLSELYGCMSEHEERIAQIVRPAVGVIEKAQSKEGGWYYTASNPTHLDEASVTVCALQALRAARNAGFHVDGRTIDGALRYVKGCQVPGGKFKYSRSRAVDMSDRTTYALTVAALSTLNAAGVYRSEELRLGLEHVRRELAEERNPWLAAEKEHDFYANLYAAQTLYQDGGDLWAAWYPAVRDHLLRKQREDGSWESNFGDEYATAMALLILEVPLGYLPMFQR
ncbi:MAG: terpene cyclase/mutase family protein [Planctomycetes bacterium]|nr:terpene cyclase/mutase family protein [Planctomycetota bacterium]